MKAPKLKLEQSEINSRIRTLRDAVLEHEKKVRELRKELQAKENETMEMIREYRTSIRECKILLKHYQRMKENYVLMNPSERIRNGNNEPKP